MHLHSLYHDPQVCSQWDGFISKRVWGSRRGREGLRARLAKQVHHHHSHHEDMVEQAIVRMINDYREKILSFKTMKALIKIINEKIMGMLQVRYVQPAEEEVCETKGGEEGQVMMMMRRRIMMMMTRNTGDEPSCQ